MARPKDLIDITLCALLLEGRFSTKPSVNPRNNRVREYSSALDMYLRSEGIRHYPDRRRARPSPEASHLYSREAVLAARDRLRYAELMKAQKNQE